MQQFQDNNYLFQYKYYAHVDWENVEFPIKGSDRNSFFTGEKPPETLKTFDSTTKPSLDPTVSSENAFKTVTP